MQRSGREQKNFNRIPGLNIDDLQTLRDILMTSPQGRKGPSTYVSDTFQLNVTPQQSSSQTETLRTNVNSKTNLVSKKQRKKANLRKRKLLEKQSSEQEKLQNKKQERQKKHHQASTKQQTLPQNQPHPESQPLPGIHSQPPSEAQLQPPSQPQLPQEDLPKDSNSCDVCGTSNDVKYRLGSMVCAACRTFYFRHKDLVFTSICVSGSADCRIEDMRICPFCRWQRMKKLGLRTGAHSDNIQKKTSRYPTRSSKPILKLKSEPCESILNQPIPTKKLYKEPPASGSLTPVANTIANKAFKDKRVITCSICNSPNGVTKLICAGCRIFCKYYKGKILPECQSGQNDCTIDYKDKKKCIRCRIYKCIAGGYETINSYIHEKISQNSTRSKKASSAKFVPEPIVIELGSSESLQSPVAPLVTGQTDTVDTNIQKERVALLNEINDVDNLMQNFSSQFYGHLSEFRPGANVCKSISDEVSNVICVERSMIKRSIPTSRIDIDPKLKLFTQEQGEPERERSPEPVDKIRTYSYCISWKASQNIIDDEDAFLIEEDVFEARASSSKQTRPVSTARDKESSRKSILTIALKHRETIIDRRPMLCRRVKQMTSDDRNIMNLSRRSLIAPEEDCDSDIEVIEIDCDT